MLDDVILYRVLPVIERALLIRTVDLYARWISWPGQSLTRSFALRPASLLFSVHAGVRLRFGGMQRIIAPTVGGMGTATILSLLVLPGIYGLVTEMQERGRGKG